MNKGKSYNRIVFLTTLSLYLGLVLVSGNACSLSHSATTPAFDVKNEIEFKDDFDNNPDQDFPTLFAKLLNDLKDNAQQGKIELPLKSDFYVDGDYTTTMYGIGGGNGISTNLTEQNLSLFLQRTLSKKFRPRALDLADHKGDTKAVKINLLSDGTGLSLKVSFEKTHAQEFADFLNREYASSASETTNVLLKQLYENSSVTAKHTQVFIVTRLPRGSIDSFLK